MAGIEQAAGLPQTITATPPHPTSPHSHHNHRTAGPGDIDGEEDRADADYDSDDANSYVCQFNAESCKWECVKAEYKSAVLQAVMDQYENKDGSRATIDQLKEFGITVYLAEHDCVNVSLLKQVVQHVAASKSDRSRSPYENQRCLLYRDANGRLYNLTLNNGSSGLAGTWKSLLISYSGLQALVALTVLTRAYACADVAETILKPGYLSLILGLILYEEISHVWLNVSMFVRGTPSVAAYTLISNFDSDWPRKSVVFMLALTSAMEEGSDYQRYCTLTGIGLAMILLAANMGSRAWYFMKWKPIKLGGRVTSYLAPIISLFVAFVTGLIFPYMGFGKIQAGGKAAVQLVVSNCIIVALLFVASDLDVVQKFIVVGSQSCDQDNVNITLGIWFTMTSITCIFAAQKISPPEPHPEDNDPILIEEQTSPVGYKVPNFPDFPIDTIRFSSKGISCCSLKVEVILGLLVSVGIGAFVVSTSLYDYMSTANEYISSN
ncbi:hypothetical protein ACHAXR_002458 [Thalassiosira sp. AJA248-18]